MLSNAHVKGITSPPHTSGLLQMLDLVFFGAMKREIATGNQTSIHRPIMLERPLRFRANWNSHECRAFFIAGGFKFVKANESIVLI